MLKFSGFSKLTKQVSVGSEVKPRNPQLLLLGSDLAAPTETSPFGLELTLCTLHIAIHPCPHQQPPGHFNPFLSPPRRERLQICAGMGADSSSCLRTVWGVIPKCQRELFSLMWDVCAQFYMSWMGHLLFALKVAVITLPVNKEFNMLRGIHLTQAMADL